MLLRELSELVSLESPELLVEPDPDPLADLDPQVAEATLRSLSEERGRLFAVIGKEAPPPTTLSQYKAAWAAEKAPWRLICERLHLPGDPMHTRPTPPLLRLLCQGAKTQELDPQFKDALFQVLIENYLRTPPKYTKTEYVGGLANALVTRSAHSTLPATILASVRRMERTMCGRYSSSCGLAIAMISANVSGWSAALIVWKR